MPTRSHNEQCDAQMETSTKKPKRATKSHNKRHFPVLVFKIELILSQKQERATKSTKRQRTANGNTHQKPKRTIKSIFHSHFHSFAPILDLWKAVDIKSNEKPERATTGNGKQQKATTSNNGQRSWKTKTGKKKSRRATKGTKSPNGNQALKLHLYYQRQPPLIRKTGCQPFMIFTHCWNLQLLSEKPLTLQQNQSLQIDEGIHYITETIKLKKTELKKSLLERNLCISSGGVEPASGVTLCLLVQRLIKYCQKNRSANVRKILDPALFPL